MILNNHMEMENLETEYTICRLNIAHILRPEVEAFFFKKKKELRNDFQRNNWRKLS